MGKKALILLATALLPALLLTACGQEEDQPELTAYALENAVSSYAFSDFEKENEVNCTVTFFTTAEALYEALRTGEQPDVVVTRDYSVARMLAENRLQALDAVSMENLFQLDAEYLSPDHDPDNRYTAAVSAGTMGILYDTGAVAEGVTGWGDLWEESLSGSIVMPEDSRYVLGIALLTLGYDVNTADAAQLAEALGLAEAQAPAVYAYSSGDAGRLAEGGKVAVTDSAQAAAAMALDSGLAFVLPAGGVVRYINAAAVCAGSQQVELASRLIDYLCAPQVMAESTAQTGSSVTSQAAYGLLEQEIQDSAVLYPGAETLEGAVSFGWVSGMDSVAAVWSVYDGWNGGDEDTDVSDTDGADADGGDAEDGQ